jgi:hypothetical protein
MNVRSAAVAASRQQPKPEFVYHQMNNPAAALPFTIHRNGGIDPTSSAGV